MIFQKEVIAWYHLNKRDLPWRHTNDPYVIWLSEIILQQTRVEQGLPYFHNFLENFPSVADFSAATEAQVLKLWQGLGYYSRGRNMHATAQIVMKDFKGIFPTQHDDLIKLKGIGEYTAAAISSFSSGENRAVVDGNVYRLLSRYFGIRTPINSPAGKKEFFKLANELLYTEDSALYNQAIMEFGAMQCKPQNPNCNICPLQLGCYAYQQNEIKNLPVKLKLGKQKHRFFNYFICTQGNKICVKERKAGDIWQHLYDFPCIETSEELNIHDEKFRAILQENLGKNVQVRLISQKKHLLSHQIIHAQFFEIEKYIINFSKEKEHTWVTFKELDHLPQPIIIHEFLEKHLKPMYTGEQELR
ncbi:A/G-specific adenine glycosylase [Pedobacter sp. MW01-1-1]|uniref:A/G-specific adenine glycosylase n=1 Tax=Pedobacter sp. MW01-1-1 TaxID=3383027 RepID=UPI003FF0FB52